MYFICPCHRTNVLIIHSNSRIMWVYNVGMMDAQFEFDTDDPNYLLNSRHVCQAAKARDQQWV